MKQNGKSDKPFTLNSHILERVKAWENLVSWGSGLSLVGRKILSVLKGWISKPYPSFSISWIKKAMVEYLITIYNAYLKRSLLT